MTSSTPKDGSDTSEGGFPSMIRISRPYLSERQIDVLMASTGLTRQVAVQLRLQAYHIIWKVAETFKFPVKTVATSMMLYHRFILFNRYSKFPSTETIAACILVASKLEDTPKRGREIVAAALAAKGREIKGTALDDARTQAVALERQILETVGFDFRIRYPHPYVVKICRERKIAKDVASMAWTISSDAYATEALLKIAPHSVALACIILAAKIKDVNIFPVDSDALESPRLNVNTALIDLLDFYIDNLAETSLHSEYADVTVDPMLSLREKVGRELSARGTKLPDGDDVNPDLEIRDPRLSDRGSVRYVLEWDKGHLQQELKGAR